MKVDRTQVLLLQICPFCDQPITPRRMEWFEGLPRTNPSILPDLIAQAWAHSEPSVRGSNRDGRRVKSEYTELQKTLCNQHRYETLALPVFIQYKWPTRVNFSDLLERLTRKSVMDRLAFVYYQPEMGLLASTSLTPSKPVTRRGPQPTDEYRNFLALERRFDKRKDKMAKAG